jgi:hypothetical protein
MKTDFRIIDHEHPLYMSMFSDEANIQVYNMVNILILEATRGEFARRDLQTVLREAMDGLEKNGYTEIYDTEVRMKIAARLNRELLAPMGWVQIDYFFDDWDGAR